MSRFKLTEKQFWAIAVVLILFKLVLTSDLAIEIIHMPHDDSLYAWRAFHLLLGEGMGPYDARLFVKLPGFSFWLAAIRLLGIPYLFSINLFYILAGAYFITALLRHSSLSKPLLLFAFTLYLFNPVTLDHQWFSLLREPLSICLFVMMFGAMLFILGNTREKHLQPLHVLVFGASFAFSLLVREEDRLLYAALPAFVLILLWYGKKVGYTARRGNLVRLATVLVVPLALAFAANAATRHYYAKWYGTSILHELGQGEFPKFIAAMRSVVAKKRNRHVMIPQESLAKVREAVPDLRPVIDQLPPPGKNSYSCKRFGVCSEWTNGFMVFWIKDAAYDVGLTPDALSAQRYFRKVRLDIEKACKEGRLTCRKTGDGLFPPFQIRWTRAYFQEAVATVKMMVQPPFETIRNMSPFFKATQDEGRMFQLATMTHYFDSALNQGKDQDSWPSESAALQLSLKYWLRYPDVALSKEFGPGSGGPETGAARQYRLHGRQEKRIWEDIPPAFKGPLRTWREPIIRHYRQISPFLQVLGLIGFASCFFLKRPAPLDPMLLVGLIFAGFTLLRLGVLSYISVYMGTLDPRLAFSTFVVANLLSPVFAMEGARAAVKAFSSSSHSLESAA
jgi:hypothetical protein